MPTSPSSHSALPPKRRFHVPSLDTTSKMPTSPSSHSALPPKRRFRVQSLSITSKMPTSPSSQSTLPLKRRFRVQLLGVASKTPTSPSSHSALLLKKLILYSVARQLSLKLRYCVQSLGGYSKSADTIYKVTRQLFLKASV
jgi:hypothetical protein